MAYVYEINGQRVEFEKEPTEADIDEAARQLGPAPAPETSRLGQEAQGIGQILAVPAAQALNYALENPIKTIGGAYGAYKSAQLANAGIDALKSIKTPPVTPAAPPAPAVTPTPAAPQILNAQGQPITRPVAPAPTPPAAQPAQPSIMDKASQIVRQLAANRAVQYAAKGGAFATGLLTPSNVGQNYPFPQSGPLRGSEINPATGRPWTPQELAAYRAQYGG